ncbi:unnamed protein product [Tenebrio molitor]|nr:unnamed protein product [Tenebrio molitor]
MLLWVVLNCILVKTITSGEVITLIKNHSVTCVATQNSVVYVSPIIPGVRRELRELRNWLYSDWVEIHSKYSFHGPVTDRRWQNFMTTTRDGCIIKNTQCFSTYSDNSNVNITFSSKDMKNRTTIYLGHVEKNNFPFQWFHYCIVAESNNFNISIENITENIRSDFVPYGLVIHKNNLKFHDYYFYYSDEITLNKPSKLTIESSEDICLSIFVSVDKNCYLNMILKMNQNIVDNKTVEGFNEHNSLKMWKKIEIRSNSSGKGELIFYRKRSDNNQTKGYWAIDDIHFCDKKIETFSTNLSSHENNTVFCKSLTAEYRSDDNYTPCTKIGYLGKNCNISCEELLGRSYSNCSNHKICLENEICYCGWGYTGSFCNERCGSGYWGANCSSLCNPNCETCDSIIGCVNCTREFFGEECSKKLPVALEPPLLISLEENLVIISLANLRFDADEAKPEYYQIQYKQVSERRYTNFSDVKSISPSLKIKTYKINNLTTKAHAYKIRIILIVQNKSFTDNVPELLTYKSTLLSQVYCLCHSRHDVTIILI